MDKDQEMRHLTKEESLAIQSYKETHFSRYELVPIQGLKKNKPIKTKHKE
jgi:hypothetical protein